MQVPAELTDDDDERLARAVLDGDDRAIEEFKDLLRPGIYNLLKLRMGGRRSAQEYNDLFLDVVTYLIVGVRQTKGGLSKPGFSPLQKWLTGSRGSLVGFCLMSARNYLVDLSRIKEISTQPLPEKETDGIPRVENILIPALQEDDLFTKELKRAVQDIYERLPPHDRLILTYRYHLEMTDAAIGHELDISETAARKRRDLAEKKFLNMFRSKYGDIC
jgi:RNA polymerase sigma factor (sigma-70 family)